MACGEVEVGRFRFIKFEPTTNQHREHRASSLIIYSGTTNCTVYSNKVEAYLEYSLN